MTMDQETWTGIQTGRAAVLKDILENITPDLLDFVEQADQERQIHANGSTSNTSTSLVNPASKSPSTLLPHLQQTLSLFTPNTGPDTLPSTIHSLLKYSVNPSSPGFLDKLYSAPLAPGIAADLLLSALNTNLHVYQVSPVLTLIEKTVTKQLASLFGFTGPRAGGVSVQGGSASNLTSIVIARNTLFPATKREGNAAVPGGRNLMLFTSAHGHYSVEKAAQALGLGSQNVISVPVDDAGRMRPTELQRLIVESRERGEAPFYINATAGSTVLGSFDPFEDIAGIAREHGLWLHVDAAWGGGFVFSRKEEIRERCKGWGLADSIAFNPHKMLGVPLTCSFLMGRDLRVFREANTLRAGYLFHDDEDGEEDGDGEQKAHRTGEIDGYHDGKEPTPANGVDGSDEHDDWEEPYDLADLTLQCGRRGDSLKFFLCWKYYGTSGYAALVDNAHDTACYLAKLVRENPNLTPVLAASSTDGTSENPSCLQVCFYYTPRGKFFYGLHDEPGYLSHDIASNEANGAVKGPDRSRTPGLEKKTGIDRSKAQLGRRNSRLTAHIAKALIPRGFMVDFAPALESQQDKGKFFRVVVNISTMRNTVRRLVEEIEAVGDAIVAESRSR